MYIAIYATLEQSHENMQVGPLRRIIFQIYNHSEKVDSTMEQLMAVLTFLLTIAVARDETRLMKGVRLGLSRIFA